MIAAPQGAVALGQIIMGHPKSRIGVAEKRDPVRSGVPLPRHFGCIRQRPTNRANRRHECSSAASERTQRLSGALVTTA